MDEAVELSEFGFQAKARRKVFVSFYHDDDEWYRAEFARRFAGSYISKSVELGDIQTDLSVPYIRALIRRDYLSDASVVVVLVGANTKHRKHVDWEISAGLEPFSGRSGLLGVLLPEFPLSNGGTTYQYEDLPARLADNVKTGYADLCVWSEVVTSPLSVMNQIDSAFERRLREDLVSNSRIQMHQNTGP